MQKMIYDHNDFAETRTATASEMTLKWCGNPAKGFTPSNRFCELQELENIRLDALAKAEDYRAVLLQRKRENFANLSNADKLDVLVAMFDLVPLVEHKPIEVAKVATTTINKPNKVEFIAVEKQTPKKEVKVKGKHFDRNTLF
jgi:hypothetical protein